MGTYTGIWIDHSQAIIVTLDNGRETVDYIKSNVEGHFRLSGGSRSRDPWGPQDVAPEGRPERRRRHHLHRFYRDVMNAVKQSDRLFIFGPSEAKTEFVKELKKTNGLLDKMSKVERSDRMTTNQIAAKVKAFFKGTQAEVHNAHTEK